MSRLQHLTLLATAWFLSHDEAYARRVAEQLRSWWRENPFLSGVQLDEWHRGRHPPDQHDLDPASAGRLAGGCRPVRARRARRPADPLAPAVPRRHSGAEARQPTTTSSLRPPGSSSPAARSRGSPRAAAGGASPLGCSRRADPQHLSVWHRARACLRLSVFRRRARPARRGRGRGGWLPDGRSGLDAAVRHGRQRRGPARRADAATATGRRRRGPCAAAGRADCEPMGLRCWQLARRSSAGWTGGQPPRRTRPARSSPP